MTHAELVALAARWLRNTQKCQAVFAEPTVQTYEQPDAIGWCGGISSLMGNLIARASRFEPWEEFVSRRKETAA